MAIRKERRRIHFYLRNLNPNPGISSIRTIQARGKRPSQASSTDLAGIITDGIRQSERRCSRYAACSFVDVCFCSGGRLGCACDVEEEDVLREMSVFTYLKKRGEGGKTDVADGILDTIGSELEESDRVLGTRSSRCHS